MTRLEEGRLKNNGSIAGWRRRFLQSIQTSCGATKPSLQWISKVKRPVREATHSSSSTAEISNEWKSTCTAPYSLRAHTETSPLMWPHYKCLFPTSNQAIERRLPTQKHHHPTSGYVHRVNPQLKKCSPQAIGKTVNPLTSQTPTVHDVSQQKTFMDKIGNFDMWSTNDTVLHLGLCEKDGLLRNFYTQSSYTPEKPF